VQFNCVKNARKTELNVLWHSTGFPSGLSVFFFWSVLGVFLCVWLRWTKTWLSFAVCWPATSAIILSEKKKRHRKMCSKKWYLERSMSYHLLNELLETDMPWDDAIAVSAGKLRKLWDSLSDLRSSLCERRLERTVLRPAILPVKTAQFTQYFRWVWRHTVKSLKLTENV
jgi:hypothetical protein